MVKTNLVGFLALIILSGCAASSEETASDWLYSEGRTVVVRINHQLRQPDYHTHESQALKNAVEYGSGAALGSVVGGTIGGGPLGAAVGVVLAPLVGIGGAIYGASTAEPEVHYHGLEDLEGASTLVEVAFRDANLQDRFRRELEKRSPTPSGHRLVFGGRFPDNQRKNMPNAAYANVYINIYSLIGEAKGQPSVLLLVSGATEILTPEGTLSSFDWSFESSEREISEWRSNDAVLFRREVDRAAKLIVDEILGKIERPDSFY